MSKLILVKYINIKLITRNGPKGTKLTFLFQSINNEIGNAKKLAKNITNSPSNGLITNPNTNINLISPPPKLSFLNKKLPKIIIKYITPNKHIPDKILNNEYKTP